MQVTKKYREAQVRYVEFSVGWGDMVDRPWVAQEVGRFSLHFLLSSPEQANMMIF
jgi:hypothetical protein